MDSKVNFSKAIVIDGLDTSKWGREGVYRTLVTEARTMSFLAIAKDDEALCWVSRKTTHRKHQRPGQQTQGSRQLTFPKPRGFSGCSSFSSPITVAGPCWSHTSFPEPQTCSTHYRLKVWEEQSLFVDQC